MEWIELDPQALPKGEVLAANFKPGTYGYKDKLIGHVYNEGLGGGGITCINEGVALNDCTHYIDIHKFDI